MGIYKLMQLLQEKAPNSIKKQGIEMYSGRTIACDASMAIYQFLISTQGFSNQNNQFNLTELTDKDGNRTGHLVGLFNRSLQFLENGIKPIWVFDGKPPQLKSGELARRKKIKAEAKEDAINALEEGNIEDAMKFKQKTTTISKQMTEDAKTLLRLLGLPVIEAPCEAEAQCAAICKAGKAFATATEDMDALTFQSPYLLRGFNSKKEPITEVCYEEMMKGLELTFEEFVDMCILCGCDYTDTIDGVGPITAYKKIQEFKTIEKIIEALEEENNKGTKKKKYVIPAEWKNDKRYEDARDLFFKPVIDDAANIKIEFQKPDEEKLKKFLIEDKGFSETRVESGLKRIRGKTFSGYQSRLENFFGKPTVVKSQNASTNKSQQKGQVQSKQVKTASKETGAGAKKKK